VLTANSEQHQDLFWAVRGGGGNFGVVVSFTYRLHPVTTVLAGGLVYSSRSAREALGHYHRFAGSTPDAMSTAASVWLDPAREPVVSVGVCWSGPIEEGRSVLRALRESGPPPEVDEIDEMAYVALQKASDGGYPPGRQHYWKAGFLRQLPDEAIDVIVDAVAQAPSPYTGLQQMTGVASRVPSTATAFAHRAEQYDCLILSPWDSPAESEQNIAWTRALFEALAPYLEAGVYVNNLGEEEAGRVRDAFGDNYRRLAEVKGHYDPENLFRFNPNIARAPA
jgi:FAD/FMN-containing dehydrogenase